MPLLLLTLIGCGPERAPSEASPPATDEQQRCYALGDDWVCSTYKTADETALSKLTQGLGNVESKKIA